MYKNITLSTLKSVFDNSETIFYALLPHVFLLLLMNPLLLWMRIDSIQEGLGKFSLYMIIYIIFKYFIIASAMSRVHRVILLNESYTLSWSLLKFNLRDFSFLWYLFVVGFIVGFPIGITAIVTTLFKLPFTVIGFLCLLLFILLFPRLSLVLPSIAVDKRISISKSWALTKNYKFLTFFTIVIFPTIFSTVLTLVYGFIIALLAELNSNFLLLDSLLEVFVTVFVVSAVSATYKFIMERETNPDDKFEKASNMDALYPIIGIFLFMFILVGYGYYKFIYTKSNQTTAIKPKTIKEIEPILDKYKKLKNPKAISFAIDKDGRYVYGYWHGSKDQKTANKLSLEKCNKVRPQYNVKSKCKVYGRGDNISSEIFQK